MKRSSDSSGGREGGSFKRMDGGGRDGGGGGSGTAPKYKSEWEQASERNWAKQLTPAFLQAKTDAGCSATLTVAIPSSILKQVQSKELRTHMIGRIARILAVHNVDEIVIYVDNPYELQLEQDKRHSVFFSRVLQYMETPPYLRKDLFPMSPDLKFCGMLPPLEAPHHMRKDDNALYREGVTMSRMCPRTGMSLCNVGLKEPIAIDHALKPSTRVTVRVTTPPTGGRLTGTACSPSEPRAKYGLYWGFQARVAASLGDVFSQSPYPGGYDLLVGSAPKRGDSTRGLSVAPKKHTLVVFGGEGGIDAAVDNDEGLATLNQDTRALFDLYLGFGTHAGTREMRLEEEMTVALTTLEIARVEEGQGQGESQGEGEGEDEGDDDDEDEDDSCEREKSTRITSI